MTEAKINYEEILHRNLPILEVSDAAVLQELLLDKQVAAMILLRLSEKVVVVDPARFSALVDRLRKIGQLPKVITE